jgi:hypothetical protein
MGVRTLVGCLVWANNYFLLFRYCFSLRPQIFHFVSSCYIPWTLPAVRCLQSPCFQWLTFFCSGIACGKASFLFFCRVGAPPRLKTETDPVSETLWFLFVEIRTMDKVQKLNSNECYTPSSEPFRMNLFFNFVSWFWPAFWGWSTNIY